MFKKKVSSHPKKNVEAVESRKKKEKEKVGKDAEENKAKQLWFDLLISEWSILPYLPTIHKPSSLFRLILLS